MEKEGSNAEHQNIKYISYCRKSPGGATSKQNFLDSFSIQVQKKTIKNFIQDDRILEEYFEFASGRNNKRSELNKAIDRCIETGTTLIVSHLDRLSRDAKFISELMEKKYFKFICCDIPNQSPISILEHAKNAQNEVDVIRRRIKDAFVVKRDRGETLGNPNNFSDAGRKRGSEKTRRDAAIKNRQSFTMAKNLRKQGMTLASIVKELNAAGLRTSTGGFWGVSQISKLLK